MLRPILLLVCLLLPHSLFAAVVINEVAWMGTTVSPNDEWIELYSSGEATSVDGWTLSDGMNLTIPLSGTISAGSYAVLERTDDETTPVPAFLIYTGSLVNTGATLTLYRADGSIADQVAGGENWENIGGNNELKETAQYTSSGWVTAVPTPGAANSTVTHVVTDTDDESKPVETTSNTNPSNGSRGLSTRVAAPVVLKTEPSDPSVRIFMPGQVYVNQAVEAELRVSNIGKTIERSMTHAWNFGDLHTAVGGEVTHRFAYPGEYIVSVTSTFKDFVATDRVVVTVLPTALSLTVNRSGDVQVHNDAKYEVDVSGYQVVAGKTVVFPAGTFLRPNATITIPRTKLGYTGDVLRVHDETGAAVAHYSAFENGEDSRVVATPARVAVTPAAPSAVSAYPSDIVPAGFSFNAVAEAAELPTMAPEVTKVPAELPALAAAAGASTPVPSNVYPYLGLVAIIIVGLLAVIAGRPKRPLVYESSSDMEQVPRDSFPFR